jgi:hypothetical protein
VDWPAAGPEARNRRALAERAYFANHPNIAPVPPADFSRPGAWAVAYRRRQGAQW